MFRSKIDEGYAQNDRVRYSVWRLCISSTTASFPESIVNSKKAGLLACNIFTVLPVFDSGQQG